VVRLACGIACRTGAFTGDGWLTTHDPNGDVLYGVDVCVDPEYRKMRLGRRLYDARKEFCRRLNLRAIVAGGRIPGYRAHADRMSPEEYIELVRRSEIYDPILSFQLANEFHVRRVIRKYVPDAASQDNVENMDIQYSQSAVFSLADFAFRPDAIRVARR
jgi:GNAT superfamily N-acetyltransferase